MLEGVGGMGLHGCGNLCCGAACRVRTAENLVQHERLLDDVLARGEVDRVRPAAVADGREAGLERRGVVALAVTRRLRPVTARSRP